MPNRFPPLSNYTVISTDAWTSWGRSRNIAETARSKKQNDTQNPFLFSTIWGIFYPIITNAIAFAFLFYQLEYRGWGETTSCKYYRKGTRIWRPWLPNSIAPSWTTKTPSIGGIKKTICLYGNSLPVGHFKMLTKTIANLVFIYWATIHFLYKPPIRAILISQGCKTYNWSDPNGLRIVCWIPKRDLKNRSQLSDTGKTKIRPLVKRNIP